MRVVPYEDEVILDEDGLIPDDCWLVPYEVALILLMSVSVIPQLGSDCLNITNAPQWFYRSKTFVTALC